MSRKNITILNLGIGNIHSVSNALSELQDLGNVSINLADDAFDLASTDYLIMPGVGAFGAASDYLKKHPKLRDLLEEAAIIKKIPILGICVGMQIMADLGLEQGEYTGLGWFKGVVDKIPVTNLKLPHVGWNKLNIIRENPLFKGLSKDNSFVYFTHSYAFSAKNDLDIIATTKYGDNITAAIAKDNVMAVQFHPEKSGAAGLKILSNFLNI